MGNKIIAIIGKSGSGKSTLYNTIINNKEICDKYNIKCIKTLTTKPLQSNVTNNEYIQVTNAEFEKLQDENKLLNHISFNTIYGKWYYGHMEEDIDLSQYNYILNLDVARAFQVKKHYNDNLIVFNIDIDEETRIIRLLERNDKLSIAEKIRRLKSDRDDFKKYQNKIFWYPFNKNTSNINDIENEILKKYLTKQKGENL